MLGGLGVLIGEIAGVIAIVSVSVAGYRWWRNRHKVLWVNRPMPPEKLPKTQARRVHPDHIDLGSPNKVFLVGGNPVSGGKSGVSSSFGNPVSVHHSGEIRCQFIILARGNPVSVHHSCPKR